MSKAVLVTGVPGSGKTIVCKELKGRGYNAVDIDSIDRLRRIIDKTSGKESPCDFKSLESVKQHSFIRDKCGLERLIRESADEIVFCCGNATNIDELIPLFDKAFLLEVSERTLRIRLSTRTDNAFGRAPHVQDWIISWKKRWESHMREMGAIPVYGERTVQEIADEVIRLSG